MTNFSSIEGLPAGPRLIVNSLVVLGIQSAVVLVTMALDGWGFSQATEVIVFVLGVLLTAVFTTERVYCMTASVLSILCFNFFLVDPRFSFRIGGADVPGTIIVMLVVALLASYLVTNMRENERRSAEASLVAQNEQLRADLLRSVSHDLRTPLTAISGNADMLLDQDIVLSDQERTRLLQDICADATWLNNVVENLLVITRLEDDKVDLRLEVELVNDVVEEAMRHVSREASRHRIDVELSEELLLANMDARVMVLVVVNLVNNAITYSGENSHISVTVCRVGSYASVSVADDGPGVSEADKPHIFDSFYTSKDVGADGRRGIGLGLALCKSIVETHGGTIRVEDASPHGAVFTFELPLVELTKGKGD